MAEAKWRSEQFRFFVAFSPACGASAKYHAGVTSRHRFRAII
jgi:hypothetical protein